MSAAVIFVLVLVAIETQEWHLLLTGSVIAVLGFLLSALYSYLVEESAPEIEPEVTAVTSHVPPSQP